MMKGEDKKSQFERKEEDFLPFLIHAFQSER
jgi:hypothetical protein